MIDDQTEPRVGPVPATGQQRLASLDFIRGIAILGILAANIIAFGQPSSAYIWPGGFLTEHGPVSDWLWVAQFTLIDGKMRGLFTLLFGAGMILFLDRARARGSGRWLQARRLVWLFAFGCVHYLFISKTDILATFATCGLIALLFVKWKPKTQLWVGIVVYLLSAVKDIVVWGRMYAIAAGDMAAPSGGMADMAVEMRDAGAADDRIETALIQSGNYGGLVAHNIAEHWSQPLLSWFQNGLETIPLLLIGMALYRLGLFDGRLDPRRQTLWGWIGLLAGLAGALAIALWNHAGGISYMGALWSFDGLARVPNLLAIVGLAALLALCGPRATGWLGSRVSAAGRMAFTNYLGTSILMLFVFHGWALGLFGDLTRPALYGVVLLTWAIMLAWSPAWLARYRFGPLEWLWRCLTYARFFPIRREAAPG
ncbi:DUF418 domain-containing protein [Alteriqipengyuania lutimaris]|uniref:DUF418 domain-containing protein n=1 Tax=Alteriqipengyuania lutimaris TaxID=1538146 RepID=A0A395LR91_9SPHN|nr:DUF418 domain-containing protein [Alteriqipengyuania lutimaris]MBB3033862.1 uncharacterized protein [Alteriqipengyuania lutimaris]RDS77170.1 DUF418 domain-containing protein [Alteriqipengyuania lutimaris]